MSANPLSPFWLSVTISFELGLGLCAYLASVFLIPKIRAKAQEIECYSWRKTFPNKMLAWIFALPYAKESRQPVITISKKPEFILWWTPYKFAVGAAWFIALGTLGQLLTSVSLKAPTSLNNLVYDFLWARANGQPDGAHIFSYLGIPIVLISVAWKYKDIWLGYYVGGLLVAVHEVFWTALYYLSYWPYINLDSLTNLFKDFASFYPMLVLFLLAFHKYRPNPLGLRAFKWPVIAYCAFLGIWFFIPKLFLGYAFWLPVTTLNLWNPQLVHTVWKETIYWSDPLTAFFEVGSWILLFALMLIIIIKTKYLNNGNIESLSNAKIAEKQIGSYQGHSNSLRAGREKNPHNV